MDLLKQMLEFNPKFRITAKQALKSPVFDDIREPYFEQPCSKPIMQEIHDPKSFCYETGEFVSYKISDLK